MLHWTTQKPWVYYDSSLLFSEKFVLQKLSLANITKHLGLANLQVMMFGGSGGGAAVAAHLTLPSLGSWGLFQAAGMDSPGGHQGWHAPGDPRVRQTDDFTLTSLALKDSENFAKSLGCQNASDLQCLQSFEGEQLIQHAT